MECQKIERTVVFMCEVAGVHKMGTLCHLPHKASPPCPATACVQYTERELQPFLQAAEGVVQQALARMPVALPPVRAVESLTETSSAPPKKKNDLRSSPVKISHVGKKS